MSEATIGIKASFRKIQAALSMVRTMGSIIPFECLIIFQTQSYHNIQLKEDAAASLGTNHVIFKVAAHYVEVIDEQMATDMGVLLTSGRVSNSKT